MPKRKKNKTPYRCSFCRQRLTPLKMAPLDYLRALMFVRPFQCPHCFECFNKPFATIGRLPLIGRLAQGTTFVRAKNQGGVLPQRDGDIGPVNRFFRGIGRAVTNTEKLIAKGFKAVFTPVWDVVCFVPLRLLGKKRKKRRSKGKFLKPTRWNR